MDADANANANANANAKANANADAGGSIIALHECCSGELKNETNKKMCDFHNTKMGTRGPLVLYRSPEC